MKLHKCINILTGKKFAKLTVGDISGRDSRRAVLYDCICECGNHVQVTADRLKSGNTRSCGCLASFVANHPRKSISDYYEYIGKKFHRLTIIDVKERNRHGQIMAQCKCDCGNDRVVSLSLVKTGQRKSCGCLRIDVVKSKTGPLHNNWKHTKTPEQRLADSAHRNYDNRFKQWAKQIKRRDDYTCQVCSSKNTKLASHHIYGWAEYPLLRYEMSNGVCLCVGCHKRLHKQFGPFTTRKHFNQFCKENNAACN